WFSFGRFSQRSIGDWKSKRADDGSPGRKQLLPRRIYIPVVHLILSTTAPLQIPIPMPKQAEKPGSRMPRPDSSNPMPRPVRKSPAPESANESGRSSLASPANDPPGEQLIRSRPGRRRRWVLVIVTLLALAGAGGWARWRAVVA